MAVDIVINETIDVVDITVNPNIIEVNVTRTSSGGGSQTLAQTLDLGNTTGGENILVNNADAIELENTSLLKKGTYDFGGNGGISRVCSNQYEDMWQNGFRHVFDQSGFIRNSSNGFDLVPDSSFDVTLRFKVGSFWTLDNGTTYICTDATEGAAVWEIYHNFIPNLTQVLTQGDRVWDGINDDYTFQGIDIARMLLHQANVGTPIFTIDGDLDNDFPLNSVLKFQSWLQPSQLEAINGALIYVQGNGGSLTTYNFNVGDYCELKKVNANSWFLNVSNTITTPIPTNTSDLTNDGADGVNPFITALDIPVAGEASTLVREVKNMTGATLTKGTVVYISGANGNKALVSKAIATTDALSARTFGLLQSNISNNGLGNCVIIGDLSGINTSAFAEGAQLYLSGVTAGAFTDTRVLAPTHLVYVGKVTRSHPTQGQIEVQIQNGYELSEIHDVQIVTPLNNQTILYETSSQLWKNKTIIEDAIVNGVTDIAPSQNAVFDALALKQNVLGYNPIKKIVSDTVSSSAVTGVTTETLCKTYTISANTFADGDFMKVLIGLEKTGVLGTATARIRVNQTNNFATATLVGTYTASAGSHTAILLKRDFLHFKSGVLKGISFNTNNQSDLAAGASIVYSTTTLSPTSDFYIYVSVINANAGDSTIVNQVQITN
jgi:hypothetical protein